MNVSLAEVQQRADEILELAGTRITSGQLIIHFHEGKVQRLEVNNVIRAVDEQPFGRRKLDSP